jgi:hypothetical protein
VPMVFLHGGVDFPMHGRYLPAVVFLLFGVAVRLGQGPKDPAPVRKELADD